MEIMDKQQESEIVTNSEKEKKISTDWILHVANKYKK